ncbi:hypothetical protein O3P69_019048 [Scylla paramamosain]|uniref:Uncharacterized protein n=1 Tax=Scylla paramamosain TaxID=85552 RepID=A0AAW0T763_SCYPA
MTGEKVELLLRVLSTKTEQQRAIRCAHEGLGTSIESKRVVNECLTKWFHTLVGYREATSTKSAIQASQFGYGCQAPTTCGPSLLGEMQSWLAKGSIHD